MGNGQNEAGKEEQGKEDPIESKELFEDALEQINMKKSKDLMEN